MPSLEMPVSVQPVLHGALSLEPGPTPVARLQTTFSRPISEPRRDFDDNESGQPTNALINMII